MFGFIGCYYQCKWLPGKARPWNDLLCVERDVKLYSVTHSLRCTLPVIHSFTDSVQVYFTFDLFVCSVRYGVTELELSRNGWWVKSGTEKDCFRRHLCSRLMNPLQCRFTIMHRKGSFYSVRSFTVLLWHCWFCDGKCILFVKSRVSGCWSTAPHAVVLTLIREHYYCVYLYMLCRRLMYWCMLLIYTKQLPFSGFWVHDV